MCVQAWGLCACGCVWVIEDRDAAEAVLSDELDYTNHFHCESSDLVV